MVAFAIDGNPVPEGTLSFELPDSDARIYSIGVKYQINETLGIGAAYLYDDKDERTISQAAIGGSVNGTFSDASAHLVGVGLNYMF